jgi:hypothetical protein
MDLALAGMDQQSDGRGKDGAKADYIEAVVDTAHVEK